MTIKNLSAFTNVFSTQKTIRFRLLPVGKTAENLENPEVLGSDIEKAEEFSSVKELIDGYHKFFINDVLSDASFDWQDLEDAIASGDTLKTMEIRSKKMAEIHEIFKNDPRFDKLFKKELIKNELPVFYKDDAEKLEVISHFSDFTTYFTRFNKNRENIYSKEDIASSIGHRLVVENYSLYRANSKTYSEIKEILKDELTTLETIISEEKQKICISDFFTPNGFNSVLSQKGIELYNTILGGYTRSDRSKVQGINELVNLYCQKHGLSSSQQKRMTMMRLNNQILSDHESNSFRFGGFEKDGDVYSALAEIKEKFEVEKPGLKSLFTEMSMQKEVQVTDAEVRAISQKCFGNYAAVIDWLISEEISKLPVKKQMKAKEKLEGKKNYLLEDVSRACDALSVENTNAVSLEQYYSELCMALDYGEAAYYRYLSTVDKENELKQQDDTLREIKEFLDHVLYVTKKTRSYEYEDEVAEGAKLLVDARAFDDELVYVYSKIRNYATKKAYSKDKVKLNFGNSQLANGWSINKEKDCNAVILRKENNYYLGIIKKGERINFEESNDSDSFSKMIYEYVQDNSKMLPKVLFTKEVKKYFETSGTDAEYVIKDSKFNGEIKITRELYDVYSHGKMKKESRAKIGEEEYKKSLKLWIDLCKETFAKYKNWKNFDLSPIKKTEDYEWLADFYNDLNNCTYRVEFKNVSNRQITDLVEEGKLFLFQIYNKDFARNATGKKNLHTLYFEALFSDYNLENGVFQLNGGAELFWRKASLKKHVTHKKDSILLNKVTKDGETIPSDIYSCIYSHLNKGTELTKEAEAYLPRVSFKKAKTDICKDKRYMENQYFFHVPLKTNYKSRSVTSKAFNQNVVDFLRNNPDINIIGVDRGERNLLYVSLIDREGNILEQKSFNIIEQERFGGETRTMNYLEKLEVREKERDSARKDWKTIGTIKELKEGYLSAVVHDIVTMMVENNAILVMENLNAGFKRGRMKFERQVYQKFEMMLISKLNFLAFKDKQDEETGSVFKAYQLTAPIAAYKDIFQQTGFIFYVPAGYTSKIDPTTGFVDVMNRTMMSNDPVGFLKNCDEIVYDKEREMFRFDIDYRKFPMHKEVYRNNWSVYTNGERIVYDSKERKTKILNLCTEMKNILNENGICWDTGESVREAILKMEDEKQQKKLAKTIVYLYAKTVQLRNSDASSGKDYILSPVLNNEGEFFCSDSENRKQPVDADANGAYNIARKGIMVLDRIDTSDEGKTPSFAIRDSEWFEFTQNE